MSKAKIKQLRTAIEKLSRWETTGNAFGFIELTKKPATDYIYEFYCAMRILKDLNRYQSIKIVDGGYGYVFPRNPAPKTGWAKFLIREKGTRNTLFQFCLGTKINISSSPLTPFGADISLQKPDSPDDPDESHVIWIMDGKYKKSKTSKLDIGTVREFAKCVSDLEAPKRRRIRLQFDKLTDLNTNCLLTNGAGVLDHEQYCKNNHIKEVVSFDCDGRIMQIIG
jgi:hypothetical protein